MGPNRLYKVAILKQQLKHSVKTNQPIVNSLKLQYVYGSPYWPGQQVAGSPAAIASWAIEPNLSLAALLASVLMPQGPMGQVRC